MLSTKILMRTGTKPPCSRWLRPMLIAMAVQLPLLGSMAAPNLCVRAQAQSWTVNVSDTGMQPAGITATQGNQVSITIKNTGTKVHNFVIPAFYIFTQNLQPGETVNVGFTPDKSGSFPFYSDAGGKPEPGISGTLRVQAS